MTQWRWRRKKRWTFAILLTLYLIGITFGGCADRMVLHPSTDAIDPGPATQKFIEDPQGRKIEIWTARSPAVDSSIGPQGYILEFCGNATRAEQIAQFVADRWQRYPVEAWVMNYPGYGQSEGGAHISLIPPAALASYDELAKQAAGKPIFLEANSLGTASELYVASKRKVAGLVIQSAPPLQKLVLSRYGWWNLWLLAGPVALQIPQELNSLKNAPNVDAPAVFLVGDSDTLVPPRYQQMIIDAYKGPKRVIVMKNTSHWQSVTGDANAQLLEDIEWLWQSAAAKIPN
jgi:pimeloyl-ACP methyl ester carboxylesterase